MAGANTTAPTAADRIPDTGADSADDAVRQLVQYLLDGNVQQALALLSPDELAVIHDYGKLIVDQAHYSAVPVTLKDIQFTDTAVSGGTRVVLKSIDLVDPKDPDHHEIVVTNDGSCFTMDSGQQQKRFCASDLIDAIESGDLDGSGMQLDRGAARCVHGPVRWPEPGRRHRHDPARRQVVREPGAQLRRPGRVRCCPGCRATICWCWPGCCAITDRADGRASGREMAEVSAPAGP